MYKLHIKMIIREYDKQYPLNWTPSLRNNPYQSDMKRKRKFKSLISLKVVELVIKNLPKKKPQSSDSLPAEFFQIFKEKYTNCPWILYENRRGKNTLVYSVALRVEWPRHQTWQYKQEWLWYNVFHQHTKILGKMLYVNKY